MEKNRILISAAVLVLFSLLAGGSLITGELYELWFWGIGIVIIVVLIFTIMLKSQENEDKKRKEILSAASVYPVGFNASITVNSRSILYTFAIDQNRQEIFIVTINSKTKQTSTHIVKFADIISVELIEDSSVLFSKSTTRTIGGSLIGGAIAGSAGAVIGGLSGDTKVKKMVSVISVKMRVRNQATPSITIYCCNGEPVEITDSMNEYFYKPTIEEAERIVDHISVIIDMMDREYQHQENMAISKPETKSIADELEKICLLKEKGLLSEEEFQKQKERLLS